MTGEINDNSVTGMLTPIPVPYIALHSISVGGKFYWAKAFLLKMHQSIAGVQFSTDGALLIAHSKYSISSIIVVMDVSSGNVLSARSYSDGGYWNYNNIVKSMLISSGPSPMAYILSNYNAGGSCTGQHLFKFDPLTFSSAAWIKKTSGSTINNCDHLGLVFGRTNSFLYAFSWYNGKSTVSLLDTNGNSHWQYSTPGGDSSKSNSIKYKEIYAAKDMIIATSGSNYIKYNRIFSSSTSTYSVDTASSKTYRDPTASSSR